MDWDVSGHRAITFARLKLSAPEAVLTDLHRYAETKKNDIFSYADDELEAMLLQRNNRLIDLGLAQYGFSPHVIAALYQKAILGTADPDLDIAIRMACLSGRGLETVYDIKPHGVYPDELSRLLHEGDDAEIFAWLSNPHARDILPDIYGRRNRGKGLTWDRLARLVLISVNNPDLNLDKSNEHGPDLTAWDIQKRIFELLRGAPVDETWVRTLYRLLDKVDPTLTMSSEANLREMLERWQPVTVKDEYSKNNEDKEGWFTSLNFVDEFRCRLAAVYGRQFVEGKSIYAGYMGDENIVSRCAYYGNAPLSLQEMRAGYARDQEIFIFAALHNEHLFNNPKLRAEMETNLSGSMCHIYIQRCKQIHSKKAWFDPNPVTKTGSELLEDLLESKNPITVSFEKLEGKIAELTTRLSSLSTKLVWAFFILVVAILYLKR